MKRKSALVIGGGIAGLAAAYELARNNVAPTVLEAKGRLGGRIHTLHDHGIPIELGAEFVHGKSKPLLEALRQAGLSTQTVPGRYRLFEGGKFKEINMWGLAAKVFNQVETSKADCSFDEFLAGQRLAEPGRSMVRNFVMGFDAAHPDRISAHALKRAEYASEQIEFDQQLRVTQGYSALIAHFASEIARHGGRLLTAAQVRRIRWERGNVEVLAEQESRQKLFPADAAVVALPLGILKASTVKFEPSLTHKTDAIDGLEMGNVVRIVFHFKATFWDDDFGFIQAPSERIPTWWADSRGPLLTGWAGGPVADALLKFPPEVLRDRGLEIIGRIFCGGATVAKMRKKLLSTHYHNWAEDPEIKGAYSYIPVNGLDLPKLLAAPVEDTLFFAGEATVADAQTGTVFGALESGLRAAGELLAGSP